MDNDGPKVQFEYEGGRAMPAEVAEILQLDVNAGLSEDEDDESYDEGAELADLVVASVKSSRRPQAAQVALQKRTAAATAASTKNKPPPFVQKILRKLFGTRRSRQFMAVIVLAFLILFFVIPSIGGGGREGPAAALLARHSKGVPESARLQCPARVKINADAIRHNATTDISQPRDPQQYQAWIKTFRDREMDSWGHTYTQVKESMSDWKRKHFAPFLSGHNASATIYDASLGVGLNLYMTLEILHESYDLTHIVVCGNDMQQENVQTAHSFMSQLLHSVKGLYGRFCRADSTLLHEFIPRNSFDVVFASHIPPLVNPLGYRYNVLNKEADLDRKYTALCSAANKKPQNQDKLQLLQERQEGWYRKWVMEMLQIAKPGAPVIVEQVSPPLCEAQFDFGGVAQDFWKKDTQLAALIEPNSVILEQSSLIPKRYHVFMLKKKDAKKKNDNDDDKGP